MHQDYDSIAFETTVLGTANIAVGAAISGWRVPPVTLDGLYLSYRMVHPGTDEWENGFGLYSTAGASIVRSNANVTASSAGAGTRTTFTAGTKQVLIVVLARDLLRSLKYGGLTGDRTLSRTNHIGGAMLVHTGAAAIWTCPARIAVGDQLGTETLRIYNRGTGVISLVASGITLQGSATSIAPGQKATLEWDADAAAAYCVVTVGAQEAVIGGALNTAAIAINAPQTMYNPVVQNGLQTFALDVGHSTFSGGEATFYFTPDGNSMVWNANLVEAASGLNADLPTTLTAGATQQIDIVLDEANARGLVYFAGQSGGAGTANALPLLGGTMQGDIDMGGFRLSNARRKVISAAGVLTMAAHSGAIVYVTGDVTVPNQDGFDCTLVFAAGYAINFNNVVTAPFNSGDMVDLKVRSSTGIYTDISHAADQAVFFSTAPISEWKLDETGSPSQFVDSGPAAVPIAMQGVWTGYGKASMVSGLGGTAAYRGSTLAYATFPAGNANHNLAALTLSFYYQARALAAKHVLFSVGDGSQTGDLSIELLQNGQLRAWHVAPDGLRYFESTNGITGTNLAVGTAHRIDMTLGSQGAKLYLDGVFLPAAWIASNLNGWNNARTKYLGIYSDATTGGADGAFDEIRLWNYQLTAGAIAALQAAHSITLP